MNSLLARIWNSNNSLIGLIGAIGGKGHWLAHEAVLEVAGGWLIGLLGRLGWASAITLGDVVLYADAALIPVFHDHELVHVSQGRAWGPFFLPALCFWNRLTNGCEQDTANHNNRFEIAAYHTKSDTA